jgi:hypothetical protein
VVGVACVDLDVAGTRPFRLFLEGSGGFDVLPGGAIEDLLVEVRRLFWEPLDAFFLGPVDAVPLELGAVSLELGAVSLELGAVSLELDASFLEASSSARAAACSRAYSSWYALMLASKSVCRLD